MTWVDALKDLTKEAPSEEDLDIIIAELIADKNDRAAVLISAAFVQRALENLIRTFIVPELSKNLEDGLFGRDAPLSTFSSVIRIAFAFGLIDEKVRYNCNIVREIRNTFAHCYKPIGFTTPAVKTACELLSEYYETFPEGLPKEHPRMRFVNASTRLLGVFAKAIREKNTFPFPVKFD